VVVFNFLGHGHLPHSMTGSRPLLFPPRE
jgi:hypothetical protein